MEVSFCFVYLFLFYVHFATFSLQPNTALDEVTVNQDGLYKVLFHTVCHLKLCKIVNFKQDTADLFKPFLQIEFTALMKGTDKKLMRTEVFKVIKSFSQISLSISTQKYDSGDTIPKPNNPDHFKRPVLELCHVHIRLPNSFTASNKNRGGRNFHFPIVF